MPVLAPGVYLNRSFQNVFRKGRDPISVPRAAGLDLILVTHGHADHDGGVENVQRRLRVRATTSTAVRGDVCQPNVSVLWPPAHSSDLDENNRSAVVVGQGRVRRIVVTGDLEREGLTDLLQTGDPPPADILVLPHHGARNAAVADLLLRVHPDQAWLPARAGFADEATMLTVAWLGCAVAATFHDKRTVARDR